MNRSDRAKPGIFERWDAGLRKIAAYSLALLFISQVMLLADAPRRYLSSLERLEGETVSLETPFLPPAPLTITETAPVADQFSLLRERKALAVRLIRPAASPDVYLLVNGRRMGDFRRGEVRTPVYDGDYVEIDASRLTDPGRFVVDAPDGGMVSPVDGRVIEGRDFIPVGKVVFKR